MLGRRAILISLAGCPLLLAGQSALAEPGEGLLYRLEQWVITGAANITGAGRAADGIAPSSVKQDERTALIGEIDKLNGQLDRLLVSRINLINRLQTYVVRARQGGSLPLTGGDSAWRAVKGDIATVVGHVDEVQKLLDASTPLNGRLDAATRSGLNQANLESSLLLAEMASMAPPATAEELDALERIAARYKELRERTAALQRSLFAARDRLAT